LRIALTCTFFILCCSCSRQESDPRKQDVNKEYRHSAFDALRQYAYQFFSYKPKRFYFIHIPKTGGTSLHALLENQVDLHDLYPPRRFQKADQPLDHQLVSGHFPYWFCKEFDKEFNRAFKVTILRNPVERYLSFLRYRKKNRPELQNFDLEFIHNNPGSDKTFSFDRGPNRLCAFLASEPNLEGRALLESAKKSLKTFDVVLFLENFESDMARLYEMIGIDPLSQKTLNLNKTTPQEVRPEFIESIKKYHDLDIELYEYAKTHLKQKKRSYRFRSSGLFSEKIKKIDYQFFMPLRGINWCYRENVDRFSSEYPIYRWVMDKPAKIYFNLKKNIRYNLQFYAQTLHEDTSPHLLVNGIEIPVEKKTDDLFSEYYCVIPKELISNKITELTFFSPKSYKYNEIYPGYSDDRTLSFALNRIKICPSKSTKKSRALQLNFPE